MTGSLELYQTTKTEESNKALNDKVILYEKEIRNLKSENIFNKNKINIQQKQTIDQRKLTKLYKLIEDSKLFIDNDFYERLKGLANELGERGRNRQMEMDVLEELKEEYAEK